jgi:predicted RNA-binding protein with PUA-like domain
MYVCVGRGRRPSSPGRSAQVEVGYVATLPRFLPLDELRQYSGPGQPLAAMALFRRSRLSVQRVSALEYAFVRSLADKDPA